MVRLCPVAVCAAIVALGLSSRAPAQQPGFTQIEIHDPFSPRYVPLTPLRGSGTIFSVGIPGAGFYSLYAPGAWGTGLFPYYQPGGIYGSFYGGILPPLVIPSSDIYGPNALDNFVNPGNVPLAAPPPATATPAAPQQNNGGFGALAGAVEGVKKQGKPRASNADARARSQRFIVLGDGHFAKQKYSDAYSRYKLAQQAAGDMADGYLRQGFALIAMGRYDAAARNLKRGVALDPAWADAKFRLAQLYGDNGLAKAAHIEALVQESLRAPSADTLFLLGVMLYFDNRRDEARPLLERAQQLSGGDDEYLQGFLHNLVPGVPHDQAPAPAEPVAAKQPAAGNAADRVPAFSKLPATPAAAHGAARVPLPPATAPRRPVAPAPAPRARDL